MCAQIHVGSFQKCFACNCTITSFLAYETFMRDLHGRGNLSAFASVQVGLNQSLASLDQRTGKRKTTPPHSPLKLKLLAKHLHTFLFLTKGMEIG